MKIRIPDGEIVEHENTSMFAAPHVRRELKRIAKMDNPPKEKNGNMVLKATDRKRLVVFLYSFLRKEERT